MTRTRLDDAIHSITSLAATKSAWDIEIPINFAGLKAEIVLELG
jgi:hypothetical protein